MSDEEEFSDFDISHINHEDAQEIIDWAVATSGLVIFMDNMPIHMNGEAALEKLEAMINGVRLMTDNMPAILQAVGLEIAQQSVEDATQEEEAVEAFRAELDEL